ncbi:MAG TPA: amidohydrolase family protein [Acidimicrobiia bacterium]|nr:amidohydrolase family protein [Acidimicrobiia bacterium]
MNGRFVIDVDSHFEPTADWLDEFPALKARLPQRFPTDDPRFVMRSPEMFAYFVSDDLLRGVPREKRMPIDRLVTDGMRAIYADDRGPEVGYPGSDQHQYMVDTAARVRWLDAQGIDVQNVISGVGYTLVRAISDPVLGMEALEAVNTWLSDRAAETNGRLMTAVNVRFEDLHWAVRELTRMRARGSRVFLMPSEPTGDTPPNHPDYDRLWSAVTDLGMVPLVHVGLSPARYHPAWANTDDPALIRVISVLQPYQQALVFLNAMVLGGVFERHPKLTVVFAEHGIDWITPATFRMDALATPGLSPLLLGEYRLPLTPAEYVRRNVRVTPLPVAHESPVGTLEVLPEIPVFSSDYPHFEGSGDPMGHYATALASVPEEQRESFLGANIAACFSRMGDPLAA